MRNVIQLKRAKAIKVGEHILTPQHPTGILLAHKIAKVDLLDCGKFVELATETKRLHVVGVEDVVAVII